VWVVMLPLLYQRLFRRKNPNRALYREMHARVKRNHWFFIASFLAVSQRVLAVR